MIINVFKNEEQMGKAAANIFVSQVISKPDSILGFATGSSPVTTYKNIIQSYNDGIVDFSKVTTFNLDEYCGLDHDHPCGYYYFMQDNLFKSINVPTENIHVPSGISDDVDLECRQYDESIDKAGGIDIQLLGIGHNGHIAFNEPTNTFVFGTHKVALTQDTIEANTRFFNSIDEVPKFAVSMGIGSIMKARKIVLVANGKNKAQAVYDMVNGDVNPLVPASVLRFHHDVVILLDEDAASLL